jgi:hypothetical protein
MWHLMYQDYEDGPKYEFSAHRSREAAERAKGTALKDPFWRDYIFSVEANGKAKSGNVKESNGT